MKFSPPFIPTFCKEWVFETHLYTQPQNHGLVKPCIKTHSNEKRTHLFLMSGNRDLSVHT